MKMYAAVTMKRTTVAGKPAAVFNRIKSHSKVDVVSQMIDRALHDGHAVVNKMRRVRA